MNSVATATVCVFADDVRNFECANRLPREGSIGRTTSRSLVAGGDQQHRRRQRRLILLPLPYFPPLSHLSAVREPACLHTCPRRASCSRVAGADRRFVYGRDGLSSPGVKRFAAVSAWKSRGLLLPTSP
uniref:Uncharacterized protein n=1 Tax=Steinernema glaseri TaxID=37863 RepID=A0A1I8ADS7_9BILA